jgi:APA family basic amino acid/polyamine antiporter
MSLSPAEEKGRPASRGVVGRLLIRKPVQDAIAEAKDPTRSLKKTLGWFDLIVLGVGAVIGVGIFVLAGVGETAAGPGIILSFVIAGCICALAALCYAELSAAIPSSGSAYAYSYLVLGEGTAWVLGWALILEYAVGSMTVAAGWSGYVTGLLTSNHVPIPPALSNGPFDSPAGIINLPAVLIVLVITAILIRGTKESARTASALVILKVAVVFFVIFAGFFLVGVNPGNFNAGGLGFLPFGFQGVFTGAALVFFAYIGFDAISTTAEETRNPGRDLPIGIIGSLAICTLLYVLASTVLVGLYPWPQLAANSAALAEPFAFVFRQAGAAWMADIIAAGAAAGITTVLMVMLMGGPRVFFALARDGLLPPAVAKVHKRFGTPYVSTVVTGVLVAICAGFVPLKNASRLTNIGTLFAFMIVCAAVPILRRRHPEIERPFRVPWSPAIPIAGVLGTLVLMASLDRFTQLFFFVWMGFGLMIYASYGMSRSHLHRAHERARMGTAEAETPVLAAAVVPPK